MLVLALEAVISVADRGISEQVEFPTAASIVTATLVEVAVGTL